jgi:hypothetical protein
MRVKGVQSMGDELFVTITNLTEYMPVWPKMDGNSLKKGSWGYMYNGRKSGSQDAPTMLQMNLCKNKFVRMRTCFTNAAGDPVLLSGASFRIFDFDRNPNAYKTGPEVIQFKCFPGTFSLFVNDESLMPYVSWNAGTPTITKGYTKSYPHEKKVLSAGYPRGGLDLYTYTCPSSNGVAEPVTLWSNQGGNLKDNPQSSEYSKLSLKMEQQMILVSFAHMDCFDMTFANMIGKYHQEPWTHPNTGKHHPGYPHVKASEGGNPLNDTVEIDFGNFQGFTSGECGYTDNGRNWLMSGSCDPSGSPPCSKSGAASKLDQIKLPESVQDATRLVDLEPEQSSTAGQHLWSRRIKAEKAGRLAPLGTAESRG